MSKALRGSTDSMEQAHAEWKAVRRAWQGYLAPRPANPSLRQQHLTLVTVGLGRLLYANPLWTPAPQNAAPSMTLDAIAPTPTDMAPLIQATLDAFEALMVIARRDRRDVSHARRPQPVNGGRSGRRAGGVQGVEPAKDSHIVGPQRGCTTSCRS
ncbi:hypothetical protein Pmi06nite_83470 [Planotetraspora mira]|uniref:Uncharacterized protein n=1 Tax=Planotetraspora mira TaxID=58121 RepID=A0A8J3U9A9_9ACTN|nr:hypothetical protein Pmi06nite_83470 [Planotetraspora mira]